MADKNKVAEQYYSPPPEYGKWEGLRIFLWNSETGQFMGRTGASWAKILLFYLIFYAVLVGFFAAMLAIFYQTLDSKMPKWQLEGSLIGNNPGLGFRPMPDSDNVESTLIYYRANDKGSVLKWATVIDDYLEQYRKKGSGSGEATGAENRVACNPTSGSRDLGEKQVCDVPVDEFHPCTSANQYNYEEAGPCVFLKLNKIFNWMPSPYNNTEDLPSNMPEDLKQHIKMVDSLANWLGTLGPLYCATGGQRDSRFYGSPWPVGRCSSPGIGSTDTSTGPNPSRQFPLELWLYAGSHTSRVFHYAYGADLARSGSPTVLTAAQKRYIRLLVARDPTINANKLKAEIRTASGLEVSTQTIRNCLHKAGLRAWRSWRAPLNSRERQRRRSQWARLRQNEEDEEENI
ncbi:hypothetical protein evm_006943 [Chilo suppressalis]|nr:hypothetical protein evm_006943 [Chilo suppressalis]